MPRHPDRVWRLDGATNFRDLGGYLGAGGRPLRWRRLFRSDHLGALSDDDRRRLAPLGLARTFDFRGRAEREATPYQLDGATQHALSIEPIVTQQMNELVARGETLTPAAVIDLMKGLYRSLVNDEAPRYAELFAHLLHDDTPVVIHCTAGKDRTGIAAALILLALGVERTTIAQDYLLTNEVYHHPPLASSRTPPEVLAVLWRVQQSFLDVALEAIALDHGGIDRYLERRLGLTPAARRALADRYLEPAQAEGARHAPTAEVDS